MTDLPSDACEQFDCFFPETSCAAGCMDVSKCPHVQSTGDRDADASADNDELFPWTGRQMGLIDLRFISATRRPYVVGIIGPADAGKTTLLGMLFLAIYRGHAVAEDRFAGSYTLHGWENIARFLQLNAGEAIQFPPHTSMAGRTPGLLHLALDGIDRDRKDVVLTDAPGEWFTEWTDKPGAAAADGARWIAEHADRIMIIADTAALTGPDRGAARRSLEFLVRRVRSAYGVDGVALVWSKVDLQRPEGIKQSVERHFRSCFENAPIFEIGIPDDAPCAEDLTLERLQTLFSWAFEARERRIEVAWPRADNADPFLSYRGTP